MDFIGKNLQSFCVLIHTHQQSLCQAKVVIFTPDVLPVLCENTKINLENPTTRKEITSYLDVITTDRFLLHNPQD